MDNTGDIKVLHNPHHGEEPLTKYKNFTITGELPEDLNWEFKPFDAYNRVYKISYRYNPKVCAGCFGDISPGNTRYELSEGSVYPVCHKCYSLLNPHESPYTWKFSFGFRLRIMLEKDFWLNTGYVYAPYMPLILGAPIILKPSKNKTWKRVKSMADKILNKFREKETYQVEMIDEDTAAVDVAFKELPEGCDCESCGLRKARNDMKVTKNTSTPEGKAHWDKVDECVKKVEEMSDWERDCPVIDTAKKVGQRGDEDVSKD